MSRQLQFVPCGIEFMGYVCQPGSDRLLVHCSVQRLGHRISTHDSAGRSRHVTSRIVRFVHGSSTPWHCISTFKDAENPVASPAAFVTTKVYTPASGDSTFKIVKLVVVAPLYFGPFARFVPLNCHR